MRPLPADARRRGVDGRSRTRHLPLLGGVATGPPRRWRGQPGRSRLLLAPRRRTAGARHQALGDAVPLGPAADPRGRRRLDEPRHRVSLRGVHEHGPRGPRRPGADVDDVERAVVLGLPRLRRRRSRAGTNRAARCRRRRPPPAARPRSRHRGAAGRRRRAGGHHAQLQPGHRRASRRPGGRRSRPPPRRAAQPDLSRPDPARRVPGRRRRRSGAVRARRPHPRR